MHICTIQVQRLPPLESYWLWASCIHIIIKREEKWFWYNRWFYIDLNNANVRLYCFSLLVFWSGPWFYQQFICTRKYYCQSRKVHNIIKCWNGIYVYMQLFCHIIIIIAFTAKEFTTYSDIIRKTSVGLGMAFTIGLSLHKSFLQRQ